MELELGIPLLEYVAPATPAAEEAAYHPDDDLLAAGLYIFPAPENLTLADTKIDTWANRGSVSMIFKQATDATRPTYDADGNLTGHPCAVFSANLMNARNVANSADINWSSIVGLLGVCTIFAVVRPAAVANNSANAYENDCIIGDGSGTMGLHMRSTPVFKPYVFDSTVKAVTVPIVVPGAYVMMYRKSATEITASVNGGAEATPVAAGAGSTSFAVAVKLGDTALSAALNGELYTLAIFNTDLGASEAAAIAGRLKTYFGI